MARAASCELLTANRPNQPEDDPGVDRTWGWKRNASRAIDAFGDRALRRDLDSASVCLAGFAGWFLRSPCVYGATQGTQADSSALSSESCCCAACICHCPSPLRSAIAAVGKTSLAIMLLPVPGQFSFAPAGGRSKGGATVQQHVLVHDLIVNNSASQRAAFRCEGLTLIPSHSWENELSFQLPSRAASLFYLAWSQKYWSRSITQGEGPCNKGG